MMPAPRCTVIVLNFNGKQFLEKCFCSLREQTFHDFQTVLVDNGSNDGSVEFVTERFPEIEILALETNSGFCAANNAAIRAALAGGSSFVLLLNNDTFVAPDFLERMFAVMDRDANIAVVCPKIFFAHDPERLWYAGGEFSLWTSRSRHVGWRERDRGQYDDGRKISQATGCAMLVRGAAIQDVGLLNENYWAYVEDVEWSVRFEKKGWRLMFAPAAKVWHIDGGTAVSSGSHSLRQYLTTRNFLLLFREHVAWWQLPTFLAGFLFSHVAFYSLLRIRRRDWRALRGIYRGVVDACKIAGMTNPEGSVSQPIS